MIFAHYTAKPFQFDPARTYEQLMPFWKPTGLWLSVEGPEPGGDPQYGWAEWCRNDSGWIDGLAYRTEFGLGPQAPILYLKSPDDLDRFTLDYLRTPFQDSYDCIDWSRVVADYQGIVIAPYQWTRRLTLRWYYTWDCASACIWDLSAVRVASQAQVEQVTR